MATELKPKAAANLVKQLLGAGLVPMLHGSPGASKSSIARKIAEDANLKFVDIRLSQYDPCELKGLYKIVETGNGEKTRYVPIEDFPVVGDSLPEGKNGWLILFDEFPSVPKTVQSAAYRIILDREIGNAKLHKDCHIMAAGNLVTDGAIASPMGTAMQSRMTHVHVKASTDDWLMWAYGAGIDSRITSYLAFKTDALDSLNKRGDDHTYRNPRTWEFLSKALDGKPEVAGGDLPLVEACIGTSGAMDFIGFCEVYANLPSMEDIIANPQIEIAKLKEPNVQYALAGSIGDHMNDKTIKPLYEFLKRMRIEFQTVALRGAIGRDPSMKASKEVKAWQLEQARVLLS